jgi:hypothetical protein
MVFDFRCVDLTITDVNHRLKVRNIIHKKRGLSLTFINFELLNHGSTKTTLYA